MNAITRIFAHLLFMNILVLVNSEGRLLQCKNISICPEHQLIKSIFDAICLEKFHNERLIVLISRRNIVNFSPAFKDDIVIWFKYDHPDDTIVVNYLYFKSDNAKFSHGYDIDQSQEQISIRFTSFDAFLQTICSGFHPSYLSSFKQLDVKVPIDLFTGDLFNIEDLVVDIGDKNNEGIWSIFDVSRLYHWGVLANDFEFKKSSIHSSAIPNINGIYKLFDHIIYDIVSVENPENCKIVPNFSRIENAIDTP